MLLDRERCIQCARCTRFADEIAGDPLIDFVDRGDRTQVLNFAEQPFDSYFSGNTVQICPVGALTATPVPVPRPAVGPRDGRDVVHDVRGAVPRRAAVVVEPARAAARRRLRAGEPRLAVRQGSLRHRVGALRATASSNRMVRVDGELARGVVARGARRRRRRRSSGALELHGPSAIAVLGGARGTNEDAYAWARLAKGVIGTDNVDAQLGDGLPAEVVLGLPRAEIADCDRAAAIVLLGPDLEEELPGAVPARAARGRGRARRAARRPRAGRARAVAARDRGRRRPAAGRGARRGRASRRRSTHAAGRPPRTGRRRARPAVARRVADATRAVAARRSRDLPDVRFLSALRRGNVHGALDAGLAPGFLPGRVTLDDGARVVHRALGRRARRARASTRRASSRAAADGKIQVLVLLGADPRRRLPRRRRSRSAASTASAS